MSKVTDYVDNLFFLMPRTDAAAEMRQKLMESAEDKYEALVSWGKNEDEALGIVVSEFGSMEEICAELGVMPIGMGADSREEQLARDYSFLNRRFSQGLGFGIILCVLGLVACILLEEMFFASDAISAGALLLLGVSSLLRSLSPQLSQQDKIEEQDERNILVNLKTRTSAFRWTRLVSFGLMALLLVAGAVTGEELLLAVAVGLAFSLTISFFAEFFSALYHESNN